MTDNRFYLNGEIKAPETATDAVLKPSESINPGMPEVSGIDFDQFNGKEITVGDLISGMTNMGFQASSVSEAARIINDMVF